MSPSWVGTAFLRPYLEGASNSGAMNAIVLPSGVKLGAIGVRGSSTLAANPKSARHALGGVSFVMKMFDCRSIRTGRHIGR